MPDDGIAQGVPGTKIDFFRRRFDHPSIVTVTVWLVGKLNVTEDGASRRDQRTEQPTPKFSTWQINPFLPANFRWLRNSDSFFLRHRLPFGVRAPHGSQRL
jgi:hypothetical protein